MEKMETREAADSCDSEMTISDQLLGIPYSGNQAEDDPLEADSAMVLPALAEKEAGSDSEKTLQDDSFGQSGGHRSTDVLEVDSASRAKRAVVKSNHIQVPLEPWLEEIDSGDGIWTGTISYRSDGKQYDRYYFHKEYEHTFRSKPEVLEYLRTGIVRRKGVIIEKRSADTPTNDHGYRQTTKRQRTLAATSSNPSGSTRPTRGRMAPGCTKLPHGFV